MRQAQAILRPRGHTTSLGIHQQPDSPISIRSARVPAKLGMTYEGRLRHTAWIRDGWRDSLRFCILEEEWRAEDSE